MFTILQNFVKDQEAARANAEKIHANFAAKHMYAYAITALEAPNDMHERWAKIPILSQWAGKAAIGDEAAFVDAYAMIVGDANLDGVLGGRDIGLVQMNVGKFKWFSTEIIFVRKRSDRLQTFFETVLSEGPLGEKETIPCNSLLETGQINRLLPSSGLNVVALPAEFNSNIIVASKNPIIRNFRGLNAVAAEKEAAVAAIALAAKIA